MSVDGGEPVEKGASFEMSFTQGNYIIQAVYYPKFTLTVSGSGTSSLLQDGVALTGSSFDPSKYVTLEALPAEGYNFYTGKTLQQASKSQENTTQQLEDILIHLTPS